MSTKEESFRMKGKITKVQRNTNFIVMLENKHEIMAHISGKMRKNYIRLSEGDLVEVEISPYDVEKGRIVSRLRGDEAAAASAIMASIAP
jgi:translation initiation factor IF-1